MGKAVATPNVPEILESTVYGSLGQTVFFPEGSTPQPPFHPGSHGFSRFTVLGRKLRGEVGKGRAYNPRNYRAAKPEASVDLAARSTKSLGRFFPAQAKTLRHSGPNGRCVKSRRSRKTWQVTGWACTWEPHFQRTRGKKGASLGGLRLSWLRPELQAL